MRKEKLSYVVLLAEIVAIIWLHSAKAADNTTGSSHIIVNARQVAPPQATNHNYIQAVHSLNR